jgi:putative FmdB family regulatory protein
MPLREYACADCGERFETLVRSDETAQCPRYGSVSLAQQLSVFAAATSSGGADAGPPLGCGTCGDPRGPGACRLN